jgi:protocatechuate 3,4-dioxygenase beta subunit
MPFIAFLAVTLTLAQDATPKPEELASIQGKVVNKLTRDPVKFAAVTLSAGEFAPETIKTGADGTFFVDLLRPGRYTAQPAKTGYTAARRTPGQAQEYIVLEKGAKKTGVVLELLPQAAISGRVTDENGEPVSGVGVNIESVRRSGVMFMARPGSTNDKGEYRIYNVEPGRYRVRASPSPSGQYFGRPDAKPVRVLPPGESSTPRDGPVPVYFPTATTAEQGAIVEVAAGDERQGVDIQLVKARVFEVSGKVSPPPGWTPPPTGVAPGQPGMGSIAVIAAPRQGGFMSSGGGSMIDLNGRFAIKNIAPGSYILMANLMNHRTPGRLRIEVGQGDVTNLEVQFHAPVTLTGTVRAPEGLDPKGLRLMLSPSDAMGPPAQGQVEAKGVFKIENVAPDTLSLRVIGLPPDAFVQSIRYDSQDADEDALVVRGDGQIEISIAKNGGTIEGTVRTSSDTAEQENAVLALWPADGPLKASLMRIARSGSKGHYQMQGIRPGKYRLAAFDTLPMVPSAGMGIPDEEVLLGAKTKAESVTIEPGSKLTLDLKSLGEP